MPYRGRNRRRYNSRRRIRTRAPRTSMRRTTRAAYNMNRAPRSKYTTFTGIDEMKQKGFAQEVPFKNSFTQREPFQFRTPSSITNANIDALAAPLYIDTSVFNVLSTSMFPNPNPTILNYKYFRVKEFACHVKVTHTSEGGVMQSVPSTFYIDYANYTGIQTTGNSFGRCDPNKVLQLTCNNIKDMNINTHTSKTGDYYFKYVPKNRYNQWINTGSLMTLIGTQNQTFAFANLINFQESNSQTPFVPNLATTAQLYKNFHILVAPHNTFLEIDPQGQLKKNGQDINLEVRFNVTLQLYLQDNMGPLINPVPVLKNDDEEDDHGFTDIITAIKNA